MIEISVAISIGIFGFLNVERALTYIVIGIIAVIALFYLNARKTFQKGYPFFCKWTGLKLKTGDGSFLHIGPGITRQFIFLIWLAALLGIAVLPAIGIDEPEGPTLWIGLSIFLWIAGTILFLRVTKKHRHVYDLLTGCYPLFQDETIEDIKGRIPMSKSKPGMKLPTFSATRMLFGVGIGGLGISYLLNPHGQFFIDVYGIFEKPLSTSFSYLVGLLMILASIGLLSRKQERPATLITGIVFGIFFILKLTSAFMQ